MPSFKDPSVMNLPASGKLAAQTVEVEFHKAVRYTVSQLFGADPKENGRCSQPKDCRAADFSGIVPFLQPEIDGFMMVSFPRETISKLLSKLYGMKVDPSSASLAPGVGELTNQIYGALKTSLAQQSDRRFPEAIPACLVGDQHFALTNFCGTVSEVTFRCEFGEFQVYTCLHSERGEAKESA